MTACGYWCKTMFIELERSRGCIMTLEGSVVHMQNRKPATSHILISTLFHKRNWDDSRMIRREWIIYTPPKIRWSQIIIRTMIITMITIVNNWFIRQRAFIEIWSTGEVWRARKMLYVIIIVDCEYMKIISKVTHVNCGQQGEYGSDLISAERVKIRQNSWKYLAILHTKTSNKLFIKQVLL